MSDEWFPVNRGHVEYAFLAFVMVALIQIVACMAVKRGRALRVFEAASGVSVAAACIFTLFVRGTFFPRQVLATLLMTAWGARLSAYLYKRAIKSGHINVGARIVWSLICSIPTVVANTKQTEVYRSTSVEAFFVGAAWLAIALEFVADEQKLAWHKQHPADGGEDSTPRPGRADFEPPVCHTGLWAYSRHPNFFFEIMFHFAVYGVLRPVGVWPIVLCPVALAVLIMVLPGGVLTIELQRNSLYGMYPSYVRYRDATPVLIPAPSVHHALGLVAPHFRNVACCELPVYEPLE